MSMILAVLGCGELGGAEVPTAVVSSGPFDVVLAVRGELEAVRTVAIEVPPVEGQAKITWIVADGARVAEGDPLVRFDRSELQDKVDKARDDLRVAETKIAQGRAASEVKVGDLEDALANARLDLERATMRVTDSEAVPRVDRESARLDVQSAHLSVSRAEAAIAAAALDAKSERELLEIEVDRARRQVTSAEHALGQAEVKAPAPGLVVLKVNGWSSDHPPAAGDSVYGGQSLLDLPDLSEMRVRAWVDEVDASKVAAGQGVRVVVDANPDAEHRGTIDRVAELAVHRGRGTKQLAIEVKLERTTPDLKPGLTVRADLLLAHHDDVLSIPREALFYDGEETYAFTRTFSGWDRRTVTVGAMNDGRAVVTGGLAAGDEVALVDPASTRPTPAGVPAPAP